MALPIASNNYLLVPKCSPDMAVTISVITWGSAVLRPIEQGNGFQQWTAYKTSGDSAFMFKCESFVLAYGGDSNSNGPVFTGGPDGDTSSVWNLIPNGDFFVMQNGANTDQNLNVAGDGPYPAETPILVWSWGGGAPNELWRFVEWN